MRAPGEAIRGAKLLSLRGNPAGLGGGLHRSLRRYRRRVLFAALQRFAIS